MIVDAPDRPHLPVEVQWVRLGDLSPDTGRPQRTERKKHRVQALIRSWLPSKCGALIVNRRPDDSLHVVDGGHRWESMMELFGADYLVPVIVNGVESVTDDAEIFLGINRDRVKVQAWDQFKVALQGGMQPETEIEAVLGKRDLGMAVRPSAHRIGAVAAVTYVYETYGSDLLGLTVDVMAQAYGFTRETWKATMILGVGQCLAKWDPVDPGRLADVLGKKPINTWVAQANNVAAAKGMTYNGSVSRGTPIALVIMTDYNAGKRGKATLRP